MLGKTIPAPYVSEAVGRFTCGASNVDGVSAPSNWWSGMAGVPFAGMAEE